VNKGKDLAMTWIVMGFCIGIGLILALIAVGIIIANWQTCLWIAAGLAALLVLMVSEDAQKLFEVICGVAVWSFIIWCVFQLGVKYGPRWRWVQNLSDAYQKRTGGKV
jgi:MFS family permease